jgi:hypothetical protein
MFVKLLLQQLVEAVDAPVFIRAKRLSGAMNYPFPLELHLQGGLEVWIWAPGR